MKRKAMPSLVALLSTVAGSATPSSAWATKSHRSATMSPSLNHHDSNDYFHSCRMCHNVLAFVSMPALSQNTQPVVY